MTKNSSLKALADELKSLNIGDSMYITPKIADVINQLLNLVNYRLPLTVTEYIAYTTGVDGIYDNYELCPKCGLPLERTYQPYCDKCGQALQWISKKHMTWKR